MTLASGVEGAAKSLAKHLVAVWQWNIKVQGEGMCPPTPSALNIGQFLTDEEAEGGMGEPHWFVAYSHVLQWVGKAACGRKWEVRREALEIKASPLLCAFWHKTDVDLMMSIKHCWEPAPRTLHHRREKGPTAHVIYLDKLAVHIPTREAWDQMVWPTTATIRHVPTKAESYSYCWGQAVDLGPVMPAAQFHVTDERGTYLCTVRALVFEGSILMYNPALNEAEWVPACGLANDLSWAEERSAVALANYVPCAPGEAERIARLGRGQVVSCPGDDSSMMSMEGEESWFSDAPSMSLHMDMDREGGEESEEPTGSEEGVNRQTSPGEGAEANLCTDQCRCSQNWESIMEESRGWLTMTPTPALMLLLQGQTARQCLHCLHMKSLEIPRPPLRGVQPLMYRGLPWSKCCHWCPQSPRQLLVQTQLRSMSPSQSWTTCKVKACIRASLEHVKTVVMGRWRLEASIIYSQFIL